MKMEMDTELNHERYKLIASSFHNGLSDEKICSRHGIKQDELISYFNDKEFCDYLDTLNIKKIKEAETLLAQKAVPAVLALARLVNSEKKEVARKAASDIVTRYLRTTKRLLDIDSQRSKYQRQYTDEEIREKLRKLCGTDF